MPEVDPVFPREWLDIPDQAGLARIYRCDLTWLTSHWNCIYGNGCPGTRQPHQGCCTVGAHWSGSQDRQRVESCAQRLPGELWQFRETGQAEGITEAGADDDDGHGRTKIVGGACIFLNRNDFPAGPGCALHLLALREGRQPLETKPDVCWQIPVWFSYTWEPVAEGNTLVVTIGEFGRAAWGPGGADMNWWCSSNTQAHTAARPLYQTYAGELTALIGHANYQELARICGQRSQSPTAPHRHPADPPFLNRR
ncbi:MAG TPA: hypothetical protein VKS82_10635 [Streptosporangiaceae bacterium]|jgi:hypothetical protein|nr:hypothetical protein [Streptosporangiaceae bacterium]